MIIISPYSKQLRNGKRNPKNYPYWPELIKMIEEPIVQIGIDGEEQLVDDFRKNLPISELKKLLGQCKTWISCDSFLQHLAWDQGKKGIVLWSVSDPLIFGHPENINLLKDRSCLVPNQFLWWDFTEYDEKKFVEPEVVHRHLKEVLQTL
jgi:ADP-heptose:LPS heptosyltransferase